MTRRTRHLCLAGLWFVIGCISMSAGCRDSDPKPQETAARSAVTSTPRSGASGVRAGKPRPPIDNGGDALLCNGEACVSPHPMVFPCCLPDGSCGAGINSECRATEQPGSLDEACPSHLTPSGELAGCCRPDDRCGVQIEWGLGCVERSDLPFSFNGPLDSQPCDAGR